MNRVLPLQRVRLELDRTLRGRPFMGRALRGQLDAEEYADLLCQYAGLLGLLGRDRVSGLLDAARSDLQHLVGVTDSEPCQVVQLLAEVRLWIASSFNQQEESLDVGLSILGTSWTADAAGELELRFPEATRFLGALAEEAGLRAFRLQTQLRRGEADPRWINACAELTRGAVLGLATHLDYRWPTPAMAVVFRT